VTVVLKPEGKLAAVSFPYDPQLVAAIKEVPGRRYDPATKRWLVPVGSPELASFVARTGATGDPDLMARISGAAAARVESLAASRATDAAVEIPIPRGLALLPYQRAGVVYAAKRPATLLADEMGLGKTVQAIALVNADPSIRRVAVICPASLKINWSREIARWSSRPAQVIIGNGKATTTWAEAFGPDQGGVQWLIVNYDVLHKWRPVLISGQLDLLVLDEAHYLKTPTAQRTVSVLGRWDRDPAKVVLPIPARRRLALTGTPILNRPAEIWGLVHSFAPETFSSWRGFMVRYADAFEARFGWDTSGASHLDELQRLLRETIMVRRLKADVLTELPPKRRAVVELPANGAGPVVTAERDGYNAHQSRLTALREAVLEAEASEDPEAYREAVANLKAGASEAFSAIAKLRHDTALAKVPAVIETLGDAVESGKVVCFAWHRDVVAAIATAFGSAAVTLTGDTSMANRDAAVQRFMNDPTCLLFVGNIRAAGVGLTLTSSSHVVFAELDWTPANVTQAEDRCHRIGQRDHVLVQHLVLEGSLDATMARMLVQKQIVLDAALDNPLAAQVLSDEPIVITDEPVQTRHELAGEGLYKDPQGTVWKVQRAIATGSGRLYAKRLSEPSGDFRYVPGAVTGIDPAWRMTVDEAARYGRLYGRCMVCGRTLTDEGSIERGIGPICASKGWLS